MNFRQFAFRNVFRSKRTYAAYFLSSAFSVMIFFIYSALVFHPDISAGITKQIAVIAMSTAQWIVYVFSFFFILYSVSAFLKTRQHEFGVLMIHGMSNHQLNRLVFLENMIIGVVSIIIGIASGLIAVKLALLFSTDMIGIEMPYYISPKAIYLTGLSFLGLFIVISFLTQFMVNKKKIIQLLQGTNKPKKEPRASVLLSLVAAVLLGGSYVLSATATAYTVGNLIIPVVLMTIIGTYLFFTQLSVFVIHMLKRNRAFFWRRTNIITLSDLAYRMKDNARMFFMVCIVSTVAFCAIGTLSSFGVFNKQLEFDLPFTFSYASYPENLKETEHTKLLEQQLKDKHTEYKEVMFDFLNIEEKRDKLQLSLIRATDYNQAGSALGYNPVQLTGSEALQIAHPLYPKRSLAHNEPFSFEGVDSQFTIRGSIHGLVTPYTMMSYGVVVSDELYEQLQSKGEIIQMINYEVDDWERVVGVGQTLSDQYNEAYVRYYDGDEEASRPTFSYQSFPESATMQNQMFSIMMLSALLVGAVFFIAAGSFLYFRLYTDLEQDQAHYQAIGKIGLKDKELRKIATSQLMLLFFIPIIVAIIHSVFAFMALQSMFELSIVGETFKVLAGFTVAQIIYFLLIRWRYIKHLREAMR